MSDTTATLTDVLDRADEALPDSLSRLFDLLRIPSISTDPAYREDCQRAAAWLVETLQALGFSASLRQTSGHPMVVAHHSAAEAGAPRALFYGHYDVQPVDPLDLWQHDPFDPSIQTLADGRKIITGRGASDDKGQLMTFVEACQAFKAVHGGLPIDVTILFEGEEESGSPSLLPFLEANAEELKADFALVCDTSMWDRQTPAIAAQLRGLVGEEVTVKAASRDLHSGFYGGVAANPIHILTKVLAGLHDEAGRVTLPGFYDGVEEVPDDIKAAWRALGERGDLLEAVGLSVPSGETGRSVLELTWARPTAEVNGISGGYAGKGFKTVIAAEATAKISFRLVGDQDPEAIRTAFRAFVAAQIPADCSVSFAEHGGSKAIRLPYDSPVLATAKRALSEEWPNPALVIGMGGSIPVVGHFQSMLGMDSLLIGFGLADDRLHAPNEKYDLTSFHKGIRSWIRVLEALSRRSDA